MPGPYPFTVGGYLFIYVEIIGGVNNEQIDQPQRQPGRLY